MLGETTRLPPAAFNSATCAVVSTVPAPIVARPAQARAMARMLSKGRGEFSGTSITVMPSAISALATETASSGVMPRRIAISGRVMRWSFASRRR